MPHRTGFPLNWSELNLWQIYPLPRKPRSQAFCEGTGIPLEPAPTPIRRAKERGFSYRLEDGCKRPDALCRGTTAQNWTESSDAQHWSGKSSSCNKGPQGNLCPRRTRLKERPVAP